MALLTDVKEALETALVAVLEVHTDVLRGQDPMGIGGGAAVSIGPARITFDPETFRPSNLARYRQDAELILQIYSGRELRDRQEAEDIVWSIWENISKMLAGNSTLGVAGVQWIRPLEVDEMHAVEQSEFGTLARREAMIVAKLAIRIREVLP